MTAQLLDRSRREVRAAPLAAFGRREPRAALGRAARALDAQDARVEFQVAPPQGEQVAYARARGQGERVERLVPFARDGC